MTLDDASRGAIQDVRRRQRRQALRLMGIAGWSVLVLAMIGLFAWGGLQVILNMRGDGG